MAEDKITENLKFYEQYRNPPAEALKNFDNGTFKGTDINAQWRIKCLTEYFGMCGIGWYYDIVRTWNEMGENSKETLAFAEIKLYVKSNGEWSKGISGIGGNKMESFTKSSQYWKINDECYKMAVTDAIGNACKSLGIGADIYWNGDKSKYTSEETNNNAKVLCSAEQVARMRELKVVEQNILTKFKIQKLEDLTASQAQWVINTKEKALEKESKE